MSKGIWHNLMKRIGVSTKSGRRGETLIEIMVALFTVGIGTAAAGTLIVMAMQSNVSTKNTLIATNLAREGVEAVRNIRDTNWLRWGSDVANCWDVRDDTKCDGSTVPPKMADNKYNRVAFDQGVAAGSASFLWTMQPEPADQPLDLENGVAAVNDFYRLDVIDRYPTVDTDNQGGEPNAEKVNDRDLYAHTTGAKKTPGVLVEQSPYYRMIYVEPDGQGNLNIYSIVEWKERGGVRRVQLITTLSNYHG